MIKRLVFGLLDIVIMLSILATGASAAPETTAAAAEATAAEKAGPYGGTFYGTAYGDEDSQAFMALVLTHRGDQVQGVAYLGEGLYVDGGLCGQVGVPATGQYVKGEVSRWDPRSLQVSPSFDVGGVRLTVDFESNISVDGKIIEAEAKIDLPWFCGRDPALTATLYRD